MDGYIKKPLKSSLKNKSNIVFLNRLQIRSQCEYKINI